MYTKKHTNTKKKSPCLRDDFRRIKGPYIQLGKSGGDEEDRTPDLRIANAALSQLSYVPMGSGL